eukprot:5151246-Prorocentrum_lima.AAC.1
MEVCDQRKKLGLGGRSQQPWGQVIEYALTLLVFLDLWVYAPYVLCHGDACWHQRICTHEE